MQQVISLHTHKENVKKFHLPNLLVETSRENSTLGSMISTLFARVLFDAVDSHTHPFKLSQDLGVSFCTDNLREHLNVVIHISILTIKTFHFKTIF
jgi:hypothetical protein